MILVVWKSKLMVNFKEVPADSLDDCLYDLGYWVQRRSALFFFLKEKFIKMRNVQTRCCLIPIYEFGVVE